MLVRLVASAFDQRAVFVQGCAFDQVRQDMELVQVVGDQHALGIVPGAVADAIAGRDTAFAFDLGAEIGVPGLAC